MLPLLNRKSWATPLPVLLSLIMLIGCGGAGAWQNITIKKGLVLLPASGGPDVGWYLLDTGSLFWIFDEKTFKWSKSVQPDGRTKYSFDADGDQLPVTPFSMRDVTSIKEVDLSAMRERMGLKVIAVAGEPAFRSHIIQIDYANHRMREISRKQLDFENLGDKWTIVEKDGVLTTDLKVNGHDSCKVIIDTGATDFIRIDPAEKTKFGWHDGIPEENGKLATAYGVLDGMDFKPDHLDINGSKFQSPRIDVNVDPSRKLAGNSIGAAFLSCYLLTIDVADGAMYLKLATMAEPAKTKSRPATLPTR